MGLREKMRLAADAASATGVLQAAVQVLFRGVALLDGSRADVRVADRSIAALAPPRSLEPLPGEVVREGGLLTPTFAEPHIHLDATLLGDVAPNESGTLREGIANWARLRPELTHADVRERALETVARCVEWGTTRIRSHVDTASRTAAEALLDLRGELAAEGVTLQLVAFPQEGILRGGARGEADWREVVKLGFDAVGGIPHFERTREEGERSVRAAFDLADRLGKMVDFHCDETDDPGSRFLELVCAETIDRGWAGRVVAGHCCALHSYPDPHRAKVVELVAASGVQVVANPLDNAVLQGRYDGYPRRRGMAPIDELWAAGALVGLGHDSVRDPWYALGRGSMVDAAYMAVHLGQLTSREQMNRAFTTLCGENHLPFGGAPQLAEGEPAQLLHWQVDSAIDIIRERPLPFVLL